MKVIVRQVGYLLKRYKFVSEKLQDVEQILQTIDQ